MTTDRPTMLISTGSRSLVDALVSSSKTASRKNQIAELPSPPLSPQQDQAFGRLMRAKSPIVFEDALNESLMGTGQHLTHRSQHHQQEQPQQQQRQQRRPQLDQDLERGQDLALLEDQEPFTTSSALSSALARRNTELPEVVMQSRDWIQIRTRINTLETEISYVTRTNQLLNQELDKVNGHLQRLTSEEGEGWRKEYEFLVQQVDLMHRQLQTAYSQIHSNNNSSIDNKNSSSSNSDGVIQEEQIQEETRAHQDMTMQLRTEVKELSTSLRSWQTAFKQAEENYRRKCEGERALKQTIWEREKQLSGLVEKLMGYESEFRTSISNYGELMHPSSEQEALEEKKQLTNGGDGVGSTSALSLAEDGEHMPGIFPDMQHSQPHGTVNVDQLSVSILSWAALLATYMLS